MLTRRTIADLYALSLVYDNIIDADHRQLANFLLDEIKQEYLSSFRDLMETQLEKYVKEKRTSYPLGNFRTAPLYEFPALFLTTFHSDKKRFNETWVNIAEQIVKLSALTGKAIINQIDAINYTIHNARHLVLDKFKRGYLLLKMLDFKFDSAQLLPYSSTEVRTIFERIYDKNEENQIHERIKLQYW